MEFLIGNISLCFLVPLSKDEHVSECKLSLGVNVTVNYCRCLSTLRQTDSLSKVCPAFHQCCFPLKVTTSVSGNLLGK